MGTKRGVQRVCHQWVLEVLQHQALPLHQTWHPVAMQEEQRNLSAVILFTTPRPGVNIREAEVKEEKGELRQQVTIFRT